MTERHCEIESETGRIGVYVYGEAFSSLRPKERIWEASLADRLLGLCSDVSFEKAVSHANDFLHRSEEDALRKKTVEEFVERTGRRIDTAYASLAEDILSKHDIDTETGIPDADSKMDEKAVRPSKIATASKEKVQETAGRYNEGRDALLQIPGSIAAVLPEGNPDDCVYIYVDDVLSKHQKECRSPGSKRSTKFIANTVISIQHGTSRYCITADGMQEAFKRLMAFLLANLLMQDRQLIFFTDGATDIKIFVQKYFGFRPYKLYLDWHHLQKKCYQAMSSALKGGKGMKEEKDRIERDLYGILWAGNVKGALDYIAAIDAKHIRSQEAIGKLTTYITNKQDNIPCYAIRKGLGLHNSSNPVEKANDLIVAHRQKGKGMAWSIEGSRALASVTVAGRNNERTDIFLGKRPRFALAA